MFFVLDTLSYTRGRTNTADALRMVREQLLVAAQGDRELVPDVLLVFTDGQSNVNGDQTVPRAIEVMLIIKTYSVEVVFVFNMYKEQGSHGTTKLQITNLFNNGHGFLPPNFEN